MRHPSALPLLASVALLLCAGSAGAQAPPPAAAQGGFGGMLRLPPQTPPSPESIKTTQELDDAKREDAGRKLEWVWADVSGGFEQLGLETFGGGKSFLAGMVPTSASGGVVSAAAGARLLFFTLLLRGKVGIFDSGQLYRLGLEAGFHVPLGNVEPRVEIGAGYAQMANLHDDVGGAAAEAISLRGFSAHAGGGVDYYVTPVFSIGGDFSAELLGLVRPALSKAQVTNIEETKGISSTLKGNAGLLLDGATGWGGTLAATAVLGLHF